MEANRRETAFYQWIQWQLYEQLKELKSYASMNGVLLMGDLPFLVSRESADVWAHQSANSGYFKLELSSGAPPDMYFAFGQKWGMPPYDWENIGKDNYTYIIDRLKYAENFYHIYRIDHFIGLFRIWTVDYYETDNAFEGKFDPEDEKLWERHGKDIIKVMLNSSKMLPCAEDLGTVPECSYKTLKEFGILGTDFQRFNKNKSDYSFISPDNYRKNSVANLSTHDSSIFINWWKYEAGTIEKNLFKMLCNAKKINGRRYIHIKKKLFGPTAQYGRLRWKKKIKNINSLLKILALPEKESIDIISLYKVSYNEKNKFLKYIVRACGEHLSSNQSKPSALLVKKCLERISQSSSIFSIQLLQDWLSLDKDLLKKMNHLSYRINIPGIISRNNWTLRVPLSLERMMKLEVNGEIKRIVNATKRI